MRKIQFFAIAPISLLATFSPNPSIASPMSQSNQVVSNSSSSLISTEFPHRKPIVLSVANTILAQASPEPSPSPSVASPEPKPNPSPSPSILILEKKGELSQKNSSVLDLDGSLFDEYNFKGNQGQMVTITLESSDFDTYLALFDEKGNLLEEADDLGESCDYQDDKDKKEQIAKGFCNSVMTITLPASGNYKLLVNGRDKTDMGKYTLTIKGN
ncbi:peptidase [Oscillatoriales cyanobacterium USR001]|nr:peptidase [Oscillatoriales cyanobacterium USR001]